MSISSPRSRPRRRLPFLRNEPTRRIPFVASSLLRNELQTGQTASVLPSPPRRRHSCETTPLGRYICTHPFVATSLCRFYGTNFKLGKLPASFRLHHAVVTLAKRTHSVATSVSTASSPRRSVASAERTSNWANCQRAPCLRAQVPAPANPARHRSADTPSLFCETNPTLGNLPSCPHPRSHPFVATSLPLQIIHLMMPAP